MSEIYLGCPDLLLPRSCHSSSWVWLWTGPGKYKIHPGASWGRKEWSDPAVTGWPCRADGLWGGPELCFQSHQRAKPGASWRVGKITGKGNKNLKIPAVDLAGKTKKSKLDEGKLLLKAFSAQKLGFKQTLGRSKWLTLCSLSDDLDEILFKEIKSDTF